MQEHPVDYGHYQYPPPPSPPPRPASSRTLVLVAILVGIAFGWLIYRTLQDREGRNAAPRPVTPRADLTEEEKTTIAIFESASRSVAFITSVALQSGLFGLNVMEIPQGTGSGFVWDQDGHVVTNFHVVQGAESGGMRFDVTLADHSTWNGRVVGMAPENDLAVIRINAPASRLFPITIGASADLQVGQKVFAIGNPFGLDQTLTTGIVSALGRTIPTNNNRTIRDVIQTDAAINPGNSGGPLLDSAARLIGVNTAIFSPSGASAGIGFAIPVDTVNRVVPQLIADGKITRPRLGIQTAHESIARRMNIQGVLIVKVEEGSGAEQADLRGTRFTTQGDIVLGDIIKAIDDVPVKTNDDLLNVLEKHKASDTVTLTAQRGNDTIKVPVRLQE